jgi:hypothetical protein
MGVPLKIAGWFLVKKIENPSIKWMRTVGSPSRIFGNLHLDMG